MSSRRTESLPGPTGLPLSIRFRTLGPTNWCAAGSARNVGSAKTASPTTSTPTRRAINRPLAIDPIPLLIPPEEWRVIEAGIIQRAQLLNLLLDDIYGPRQLVQQRRPSGRPALCESGFSAAIDRTGGTAALPSPLGRRGSGALARRPLVGTRRPHAIAFGNGIRAAESHDRCGRSAGGVSHGKRQAPGFLLPHPARGAARPGAVRSSARGSADTRTVQRNLLRAFLSGALSRIHAGRRSRPDGSRPAGLSENRGGLAAGTRHSAPRGR